MKKAARETIAKKLSNELHDINRKIRKNKYSMKSLAQENEMLKRQRPELTRMINELRGQPHE